MIVFYVTYSSCRWHHTHSHGHHTCSLQEKNNFELKKVLNYKILSKECVPIFIQQNLRIKRMCANLHLTESDLHNVHTNNNFVLTIWNMNTFLLSFNVIFIDVTAILKIKSAFTTAERKIFLSKLVQAFDMLVSVLNIYRFKLTIIMTNTEPLHKWNYPT